ncbi:MAG: UDP-glucose 4-epimerase GalE [Pseudonocardiaceae bacterium]
MSWLVTGGAGYIGAHVVKAMTADGMDVVVLDDLSTGDATRVTGAPLITGTIRDRGLVRAVMREHAVDGVMHIAAKKQVGQSVSDPLLYYRENVGGLVSVLEACQSQGVDNFVFSSSAATYGMPDVDLVDEATPCVPLSPYGESKVVGEWLVRDCATWGLSAICLRYFNVAGAAAANLGDPGANNLIPLTFQALTPGRRPVVFGTDYPTPDGTCIRDYVHVADIADAHLAAVRALQAGAPGATYNVGRGLGASVLEVLRVIGEVTGADVTYDVLARRPGDPARVVACAEKIRYELGFCATRDLRTMIESAWAGWKHTIEVRGGAQPQPAGPSIATHSVRRIPQYASAAARVMTAVARRTSRS